MLTPSGDAPSDAPFDEFWRAFQGVVRREVRRRGLRSAPPRFLGIEGEHWDRQTLEELTTECYVYLLARLRALQAHLRVKPNVDGLVRLNVRHCLHERQKAGDPLGYRVFEVVYEAVRLAVAEGRLASPGEEDALDNETLLTFGAAAGMSVALPEPRLTACLRAGCDELLPDLVTARGSRRRRVVEKLSHHLDALGADAETPVHVRFKELVDAAKSAVRWRWRELWMGEQGGARRGMAKAGDEDAAEAAGPEQLGWLPIVQPSSDYEEQQAFRRWIDCVNQGTHAVNGKDDALDRLWQFLRRQAPDVDKLPSRRKVAAFLDLPRYKLPELYRRLGDMIETCRRAGERS